MFSPTSHILKLLTYTAHVTRVDHLSPDMRLIRLEGKGIQSLSCSPGDRIKVQVGTKMRSYTLSRMNLLEGWMELVIFLHGNGVASEWARTIKLGDLVGFMKPKKSIPTPSFTPQQVLFLGDETTIGLAHILLSSLSANCVIEGAIELDQKNRPTLSKLNLPLDPVIRNTQHGEALSTWLTSWIARQHHLQFLNRQYAIIWLSGEASSILLLKNKLLNLGISADQIYSKPYWSIKGHAHRKLIQRKLKA